MKINIISVGKIKEDYTLDWEDELAKRLSPYAKASFNQIKDVNSKNRTPEQIMQDEAEAIIPKLSGYVVVLDVKGRAFTSEDFAAKLNDTMLESSEITFVIGGAYGIHETVRTSANLKMSFSDLTFTHQIMRVLLLEQLYRAFSILNNRPYHL